MDTQPLKLHVDSKQAQADLAALAKALDMAGSAVGRMKGSFATGMSGVNASLNNSMKSMEKFAQVANMLGKIKLSSDPAKHVRDFANAMNAMSRAKAIDVKQITAIKSLSKTLSEVKVPNQAQRLTAFLNAIGSAKAPTASTITRINDLLKTLSKFQGSAATRNTKALQTFFMTLASIRVPSSASIARLETMFKVLASVKSIPGAQKIAAELDHIAGSAARAGTAINTLPKRITGLSPAFAGASRSAASLHGNLSETPTHANRANKAFASVTTNLGNLSSRFKLSYQAGTAFSAFFSAFTIGQFLKSIYGANIQLLKLQKAMLFTTGSFAGAEKATDQYISMADDLGLALDKTTEAYSRFTISAKATGINLDASNKIFRSVSTALQVVGANSEQTELAFYGLTQMMQKGKVVSEEFNRQIGEQIPGNAVIGAQALSKLEGRFVSVAEFFQKMQKGQILSKDFVPAYAEALNTAYSPLLEIAKRRPDVALNRLKNAFQVFAREVGRGGFMASLGREFDLLHDKIIYTDAAGAKHLTPSAEKLAKTLGQNLANMVHLLSRGLQFLVDHLDGVISSLKAMLALKVGATFLDWGMKAGSFAAGLIPVKKEAQAATAALAAEGTVRKGGAAAAAVEAATGGISLFGKRAPKATLITAEAAMASKDYRTASAIAMGGTTLAGMDRTYTPRNHFASPAAHSGTNTHFFTDAALTGLTARGATGEAAAIKGFDTATAKKKKNIAEIAAAMIGLKPAGKVAAEGLEVAEKGSVKAISGLSKFGGVLAKAGPLLGLGLVGALAAAGIALAAFGDNTTSVGGKSMKFNDIVGGGFSVLGDKIGDWWKSSGKDIGAFGFKLGDLGNNAGEIVASIVAGFVTLGDIIGSVVGGIGRALDALILGPFRKLFSVFDKFKHGDIGGAFKEVASYALTGGNVGEAVGHLAGGAVDAVKAVGGYDKNRQAVISAGAAAADKRNAAGVEDAATQKINQNAEEQLQATEAARVAAQNQGELEALQRRVKLGDVGQPKIEDILSQVAKAGQQTADATSATAAATAATAKNTSAGGVSGMTTASGKPMPAAPADVAAAIKAASASSGVDEKLLTAIAFRESSFNTKATPGINPKTGKPYSSAGGLFQFTDDTAQQYALADRFDPMQASVAAARMAKVNASFLKSHTGHDATGGEVYAAHFLGPAGATSLINANSETPDADASKLFGKAAAANPNIFYNDPKTMKNGRTVSQVMANLNATAGGAGVTGKNIAGATPTDQQTLTTRFDTFMEKYNRLVGKTSPADQATTAYNDALTELKKLADAQDALVASGLPPIMDPKKIGEAEARLKQVMTDAINPFLKDVRIAEQANDVTAMRLKGMSDEADFQTKLNSLKEEGYDISKLDTKENRAAVIAAKDHTEALAAQLETVNAINDATLAGISRKGSAQDIAFSKLVKPKDGETYQSALDQMAPETLAATQRTAASQVNAQTADAAHNISGTILESATASRLSPSAQALRADYKQYLEDLTGVTDVSLDRLVARTKNVPALQELAKKAAEIKQQIENPPGFQKWADALEPFKKRMDDIKGEFLDGLSSGITDSLYGEKVDWGGMVRNVAKQITKAQVDSAIGGLIGRITGKSALTPEQQATVDAAAALSKSAADAAQATTTSADTSATALTGSATNLTSAADALKGAAQSLSAGGAASAGGKGVDAVATAVTQGTDSIAQSIQGAGGASASAAMPDMSGSAGGFWDDPSTPGGFIGQASGNMMSGGTPMDLMTSGIGDLMPAPQTNIPDLQTGLDMSKFMPTDSGGGLGGMMSSLMGKGGSNVMGLLGLLGPLLGSGKKKPPPVYPDVNGVIGESRPVDVSGRQIAAHSNMIGDLLNMGLSAFTGGFGQGGGMSIAKTFGNMGSSMSKNIGSFAKFFGGFSEGGYTTEPVGKQVMSAGAFSNAPHYAEGTHNTSGGMPAIVHPNEAVIPLSRGRKIPVELGADQLKGGDSQVVNTHITVVTPNADSFRQSQGRIQQQTNRNMKRAAVRNLSPH